jgi:hypothetical protein
MLRRLAAAVILIITATLALAWVARAQESQEQAAQSQGTQSQSAGPQAAPTGPPPYDIRDAGDEGTMYAAASFSCNGTFQESQGVWWLSTSNPFRFRKKFSGDYYFEKVDASQMTDENFAIKMAFKVYSASIESGGMPTAAKITVQVKNPANDEMYELSGVTVQMNSEEVEIPTYVYVPKKFISNDGRIIVKVTGAGQIGVSKERLAVFVK